MSSASRRVLPLGPWLLLCVPWLLGPTQGAVGGCSCRDDPLAEPAEPQTYCSERDQLVCVRNFERGLISELDRDDCRREAIARCAQRSFPAGCHPTVRQTRACLNALHSRTTLDRVIDDLPECSRLCAFENAAGDGGTL